ncbi:protein-export chaperone SecB [Microbaculum marinisediminis]|uniref:Protein-export protein SecB n=1 Tax=Microbaculum marinisediminis TaxID=2931392 RepID=A0AAW5QXE6_9HYPH|nr:protein-export chaperone SecB [Microbaculum sp. A6E488]MCT8972204.1 protein-export chaperone SecB [Microbaculum sp. A6E488]
MTNEPTNGGGAAGSEGGAAATGQQAGPSIEVLAQYIKDLSFENPRAPASMTEQRTGQPPINFNIQVNANPAGDDQIEVELKLEARAGDETTVIFALELVYCGLFRVRNIPQEHFQPFVMIECPRLLFPFARQIVADTIGAGGFPPVMLGLIDFAALYQQRMAQQPAAQA